MQCPHCGLETDTDEFTNMTPEQVIEYYYRARAAGSRKMLKELAEKADIPYQTLKNRKVAYDRQQAHVGYARKYAKA